MKNNIKQSMEQFGGTEEQQKFHPYFITGFSDAECTFVVSIYKCSRL
jgi:hypothetical protein